MVKNYKGGYSILDTTPFTFNLETSSDVLNDDYVAEQLLEICKPHFEKFANELKPIYIRYLTNDYAIGVALATMNHITPEDFVITAQIGTNNLELYVRLTVDSDTDEIILDEVRYTYLSLKQNIINMNEDGDITLGTKLYKHTITLSNGGRITIISSDNSAIEDLNDLQDVYMVSINALYYDADEYTQQVLFIDNTILVFYSNSSETISNVTLTGLSVTDDVTPL